jgi:hypothetical protein
VRRLTGNAQSFIKDTEGDRNVLRFSWEMLPAAGGEPTVTGSDFLLLDEDDRVRADYRFTDNPAS